MVKNIIIAIFCLTLCLPAFADSHENGKATSDTQKLTETQKDALKKFKAEMKAFKESRKAEREQRKEKMKEVHAKRKKAFIEGDFKTLEKIQNRYNEKHASTMAEVQEAKIKAMKSAFADLSKEDREALATAVLKHGKERKEKKRKRRQNRKQQRKSDQ